MRTFAILAAFAAGTTPVSAAPANLIDNPGFETGALAPFFNDRDASDPFFVSIPWLVTTVGAISGDFSAQTTNNHELRIDFAAVSTRLIAQLSFSLRHPNSSEAASAIGLFYDDGSEGTAVAFTTGGVSTFFDITAELEKRKRLVGFSVFGYTDGDDAVTRLDDVTLLEVPAPAAMALFGLGVAAVLGYRRAR